MGLLRQRVTDYFEVLLSCLVRAPGPQDEGPQEEEERRGGGINEEKIGAEKPEVSAEKMGVLNTHSVFAHPYQTTVLVIW